MLVQHDVTGVQIQVARRFRVRKIQHASINQDQVELWRRNVQYNVLSHCDDNGISGHGRVLPSPGRLAAP